MEKDILTLLTNENKQYSKGQQKIAQYILNNYDRAAFMTAGKLGEEVGTSESTVVRFASELGFNGYPEMRKAIQSMIRSRLTSVQRIEVAKRTIDEKNICKSVLSSDIENLQSTLNIMDSESFSKTVKNIIDAKNIYIVGMRSSSALASFLGSYLHLLRGNVFVIKDISSSEVAEQLLRIGPDDIFIGISYPRYSKHTVDAMEFSRSRGAKTIAITDSSNSPVSGIADISLYAKSDMVSFLDSLVAPMSLINAIIVAVGTKMPNSSETFKQLESIWSEYDVFESSDS